MVLLSGPSAVGKGPLWEQLQRRYPGYFERIVLYTSRLPREKEQEGVSYFFRDAQAIEGLADMNPGVFLKQGVHDKMQGLDLRDVGKAFASGKVPFIEVSVDWAKMLREEFGGQIFSVFMIPLSDEEIDCLATERNITHQQLVYDEMLQRQKERGADTKEDWEKRAKKAFDEIGHKGEYDAVIINDKLHDCDAYQERWDGSEGEALVGQFMRLVRGAVLP